MPGKGLFIHPIIPCRDPHQRPALLAVQKSPATLVPSRTLIRSILEEPIMSSRSLTPTPSRRHFLKQTAVAAASAAVAAPMVLRAADLPAAGPGSIQGEGRHKYEWLHEWIQLPDDVKLGNSHGVQESADGRIFIHHMGTTSMLVVDHAGKVMKTWGKEYTSGAHGLQLRKEGNEEFLYLALTGQHRVLKTNLDGQVVFD